MINNMKSISQILIEILGGTDPICTTKEIAGVCETTERTVNNWKAGNTHPQFKQAKDLSHYLIEEYNYCDLAMQMMPPCIGHADGRVRDDLMNLFNHGSDLDRAFGKGDKIKAEKALNRMRAEMQDLEKEIGEL